MQNKAKIFLVLFYLCASILILDYIFILFFEKWKFTKPVYYNSFWALHYCSMLGVITFILVYKFKKLRVGCLSIFCLICFIIYFLQFNPIDTYEYPHDVKIISEKDDKKIVVRNAKSGKTNEVKN